MVKQVVGFHKLCYYVIWSWSVMTYGKPRAMKYKV